MSFFDKIKKNFPIKTSRRNHRKAPSSSRTNNNSNRRYIADNPFARTSKSDDFEAKHKSKFNWLYDPQYGVRWDFDPILCRRLGQEDPFIQMLIQSIVKEISKTPWDIVDVEQGDVETQKRLVKNPFERNNEIRKADSPEAQRLKKVLRNPNPDQSFSEIVEEIIADWLEVGSFCIPKAYTQIDYDSEDNLVAENPTLQEFKPSAPETFTKKYKEKTGIIDGYYQYSRGHQRTTTQTRSQYVEPIFFESREVIWGDLNSRSNRRYGIPPTLTVLEILDLLSLTIAQEKNYFERGMIPSGFLLFEEWSMEEIQEFFEEVQENVKGNPEKMLAIAGKGGEVGFEKFSFNFKELQFLEREEWYAKILASAFQVPLSVVGMKPEDVNRATFQGERGNFESNTLGYYLQKLERIINAQLVNKDFSEDLRFEFQPGLSETQRKSISSRVVGEFNSNIATQNEVRRQLGYEELERGDRFKHEIVETQEEPDLELSDNKKQAKKEEEREQAIEDTPLRETGDWGLFDVQPSDVKDVKEEISTDIKELFENVLTDSDIQQEIERLANSEEQEKSENRLRQKLNDLIEDIDLTRNIKSKLMATTNQKALDILERTHREELEEIDDVILDKDGISAILENRDLNWTWDFSQRIEEEVKDVVSQGWEEGLSVDEIQEELQDKADQFSDWDAERIARDQLQRATGEARHEFAQDNSDRYIEVWHSSEDDRVRNAHTEMHGKWKHPSERFEVGYEGGTKKENFPGDSREGINCRCTTLLVERDEVDEEDHKGV